MILEITQLELTQLKKEDYVWRKLSDFYLVRLLKKANELGLEGKKIKEVIGIQENFATGNKYIEFICE